MVAHHTSPRRLAAALAARLNEIVPSGLSVRSNGDSVTVYIGGDKIAGGAAIIADEDDRSLSEYIEVAAQGILDGIQDVVMETLTLEWPLGPNAKVLLPSVRVDGDQLFMWFGNETTPIIFLPALTIAEIVGGAA